MLDKQPLESGKLLSVEHDLWPAMQHTVRHVFCCALSSHFVPSPPGGGMFELFGLDFMVDAVGRLVLIEVNTQPALGRHGHVLTSMIPRMLEETLQKAVDPFFPPPPGADTPEPLDRFERVDVPPPPLTRPSAAQSALVAGSSAGASAIASAAGSSSPPLRTAPGYSIGPPGGPPKASPRLGRPTADRPREWPTAPAPMVERRHDKERAAKQAAAMRECGTACAGFVSVGGSSAGSADAGAGEGLAAATSVMGGSLAAERRRDGTPPAVDLGPVEHRRGSEAEAAHASARAHRDRKLPEGVVRLAEAEAVSDAPRFAGPTAKRLPVLPLAGGQPVARRLTNSRPRVWAHVERVGEPHHQPPLVPLVQSLWAASAAGPPVADTVAAGAMGGRGPSRSPYAQSRSSSMGGSLKDLVTALCPAN